MVSAAQRKQLCRKVAPASAATSSPAYIECWFGQPIVWGDRAAVEWWGSWTEQDQELTFAGVTVLRFDDKGQGGRDLPPPVARTPDLR